MSVASAPITWQSTGIRPQEPRQGSPTTLINNLKTVFDRWGQPIWLTEFSTRDFVGDKTTWSRNHNYNFLAEFAWRAESLPWLAKWCSLSNGVWRVAILQAPMPAPPVLRQQQEVQIQPLEGLPPTCFALQQR